MPSIARKNLFEDIPRLLVAQAGIMFAVSLITIQTGLLQGFTRSTALVIDRSKADIWVASKYMMNFELSLPIPYERLEAAQKVKGVDRAEALIVQGALWRDTEGNVSGLRVLGFDPDGQLFAPEPIAQGSKSALKQPYTVMVDESTLDSLNVGWVGDEVEIGAYKAKLVGWTKDAQSMVSSAFTFASLENAYLYVNSVLSATSQPQQAQPLTPQKLKQLAASGQIADPAIAEKIAQLSTEQLQQVIDSGQIPDNMLPAGVQRLPTEPRKLKAGDRITYVLIKAQPNQDIGLLKQQLEAALPDTRAYTRAEMAQRTRSYWLRRTGIGFILGLGAAVGIIVGVAIVAQILYASTSDHIKEFGTLKAMGASDWVIYGVIVEQALWMAVLGYLPGMALSLGLASWTVASQGIVILITPTTAAGVFGIAVIMCVSSAVFAIRRVTRVDPAIVFKA